MRSRPADLALVAGTLIAAWSFDLAAHAGAIGLGFSCCIGVAAALLFFVGRPSNRWSQIALAGSLVLAPWLTLRSSPWLQWPDLITALTLLAIGAALAYSGNPFNISAAMVRGRSRMLGAGVTSTPSFLAAPAANMRLASVVGPSVKRVGRSLAIAVPVAMTVGLLLASADPVFASFFNLQVDPADLSGHLFLLALGAGVAGALLRTSLSVPEDQPFKRQLRLEPIEAAVVLLVLDATFAVFAVAQLVAALGGGQEAMRAANMTYADYARSGFFQLLAVAAITLPVVVVLTSMTREENSFARILVIALAELAVLFTIAIVIVAHQRLSLYEAAYGFTMLRLYSHLFALWTAILFGLFGVRLLIAGSAHHWFPGAAVVTAIAILLGLNVINPEALLVRLNVEQSRTSHTIDSAYLASLSDDATPSLLAAAGGLAPSEGAKLFQLVCQRPGPPARGWASYNVATETAQQARKSC